MVVAYALTGSRCSGVVAFRQVLYYVIEWAARLFEGGGADDKRNTVELPFPQNSSLLIQNSSCLITIVYLPSLNQLRR